MRSKVLSLLMVAAGFALASSSISSHHGVTNYADPEGRESATPFPCWVYVHLCLSWWLRHPIWLNFAQISTGFDKLRIPFQFRRLNFPGILDQDRAER